MNRTRITLKQCAAVASMMVSDAWWLHLLPVYFSLNSCNFGESDSSKPQSRTSF